MSRSEVKPAWIEIAPKLAVAAAASIVRPPSQEGDHPWEEPITPRQLGPNFLQGTARILRESEIADAPGPRRRDRRPWPLARAAWGSKFFWTSERRLSPKV